MKGNRYPANTSTLIVNVYRRCFNVHIWLRMKAEPTYIYGRCFKVGKTKLKQHWYIYVDSTSMNQCCFNVEIWLNMKVEPTYVYRCCFNVDKSTLKQHWKNYVDSTWMTQCRFNVVVSWKWKMSQSIFISVASTLRKQHWNNFVNCYTNVH